MKYRSYNNEFKIATALFLDVFNDIVIDRRDSTGTIQKLIQIPCVYGSRSRILKSLQNPNKTLKLPMICASITGISRDSTRAHSINDDLLSQVGNYNPIKVVPSPMNIEYELSIISKYIEDTDQILCNFIPFFQPELYVVWSHPKFPEMTLKSKVIWDGNISIAYPDEVSETEQYRIVTSTNFTLKTYIFPGLSVDPNNEPLIKKINFDSTLLTPGLDGYNLDRWFSVPSTIALNTYQSMITSGDIASNESDFLPISAGVSGYWNEISACVSGSPLHAEISGNPVFLIDQEGDILIYSNLQYMSEGMQEVNFTEIIEELI